DVVSPTDDEIIVPTLIPEIAVHVLTVQVTGDVPAAADILALPLRRLPVATSGRSANREEACCAARHVRQGVVNDACLVAGHWGTGRSGSDPPSARRDKVVKHL